jgi:hypothetical protein
MALGLRLKHATPKRPHLNGSTLLLGIATVALIIIDLAHLTIATGFGAVALAAFVVGYVWRWRAPRVGIYGFLIAELSPISLQVDLVTSITYQVLCVLFLTAIIAPFPHLSKLRTYGRPALTTLAVAIVSLVPGIALLSTKWSGFTALHAASLSGAILLAIVGAVLFVRREMIPLQAIRGA